MAIAAPTPPTPPTAPVVPGARNTASDGVDNLQQGSHASDAGGQFGVHVNISNSGQGNEQQTANKNGNAAASPRSDAKQEKSQSAEQHDSNEGTDKAAQQARQDMVQQELGASDENQQQVSQQPWPLPGNNIGFMSYMPFIIVFFAAFITFMLKNMSKSNIKTSRKEKLLEISKADTAGNEAVSGQDRTNPAAGINDTHLKPDKNKGNHFEMRI